MTPKTSATLWWLCGVWWSLDVVSEEEDNLKR